MRGSPELLPDGTARVQCLITECPAEACCVSHDPLVFCPRFRFDRWFECDGLWVCPAHRPPHLP